MKKLTLLICLLFSLSVTSYSQTFSGTVSGTIFGAPTSGIYVAVLIHDTASPPNVLWYDSILTDVTGFYSSAYTVATPPSRGTALLRFRDCLTNLIVDTTVWDTSVTAFRNPVINGNYCPFPPCQANFKTSISNLQVTFKDTSTPVSLFRHYSWNFGVGIGDTSNLQHPIFTYPLPGKYNVCLTIRDSTPFACTSTFCDSIEVKSGLPPSLQIAGDVTTSGTAPGVGKVYLIAANSSQVLTMIDSVDLTTGSAYSFDVDSGIYYVKATLLTTNPDYFSYFPTYYDNNLRWGNATAIVITTASSLDNDIDLMEGNGQTGPGYIGGLVTEGVNKVAGPGDPYPNAQVILTDELGIPVKHTLTDGDGEYKFEDLMFGTYKLFVDILAKTSVERTVVLSATNDRVEDANFIVGETDVTTGFQDHVLVTMKGMYPNPASETVRIRVEVIEPSNVQLVITDLVGKEILTKEMSLAVGNQLIELNIKDIPKGIYQVNLVGDRMTKAEMLVKY